MQMKREKGAVVPTSGTVRHVNRSLCAASGGKKEDKKLLLLTAATALITTSALAQTTVTTTTGAGRANVMIEPEARMRDLCYGEEDSADFHQGADRRRRHSSERRRLDACWSIRVATRSSKKSIE